MMEQAHGNGLREFGGEEDSSFFVALNVAIAFVRNLRQKRQGEP